MSESVLVGFYNEVKSFIDDVEGDYCLAELKKSFVSNSSYDLHFSKDVRDAFIDSQDVSCWPESIVVSLGLLMASIIVDRKAGGRADIKAEAIIAQSKKIAWDIFEDNKPLIISRLLSIGVGEHDLDDFYHEAFLSFMARFHLFSAQGDGSLQTWIFVVVGNTAKNLIKSINNGPVVLESPVLDDLPVLSEDALGDDLDREFWVGAISELDDCEKVIVMGRLGLDGGDELTYQELSAATGLTADNIRKRRFPEILNKLRKSFDEDGFYADCR